MYERALRTRSERIRCTYVRVQARWALEPQYSLSLVLRAAAAQRLERVDAAGCAALAQAHAHAEAAIQHALEAGCCPEQNMGR
jgi:hypothetical protein